MEASYTMKIEKWGWKKASLFVYVSKEDALTVGKEILGLNRTIISVQKITGSIGMDLSVEMIFQTNRDIANTIDQIKSLPGVEVVVWSENIETIGTDNSYLDECLDRFRSVLDIIKNTQKRNLPV